MDPAILLDEATSNLDLMTEARVNAAMDHVSAGRTTIIIAHRLQTARAADRIVVLDSGQIAEAGNHEELLAAGGRYAAMWESFETASAGAGSGGKRKQADRGPKFRAALAKPEPQLSRSCGACA